LTEDDFRELLERNQQIQELTSHPGWKFLSDRAVHTIAARQRSVLGGTVLSLEDYKRSIGWLEGAGFVLKIPEIVEEEVRAARGEVSPPEAA
jgi:hypothetical protein